MQKDIPPAAQSALPENEYQKILRFARENNHIGYAKLDYATMHRVNLFAIREDYDFAETEQTLDHILHALPAIKRIFSHPITYIIDTDDILPVESVKVINNRTIVHAAVHSDLWSEITKDGIKPKKLLTRQHEDSYQTYENIGVAKAVQISLSFVRKNIRILQDILYVNRNLRFNLLERENHLAYFLAIGKLHIGYTRDYEKYHTLAKATMEKLLFVERILQARLSLPVYSKCKDRCGNFILKKSTVFRMQKDYRQVYLLLKWFADEKVEEKNNADMAYDIHETEGYSVYCTLLSLFAAGHFNFVFDDNRPLNFFDLHAKAIYADWKLQIDSVKSGEHGALLFTFTKDAVYRILLAPSFGGEEDRKRITARFKKDYGANEYLFANPVISEGSRVQISLFDVESFRRIQQLLLRGMIYSDITRDVCPFCGGKLSLTEEEHENIKSIHHCTRCCGNILHLICPKTRKPFFATTMDRHAQTGEFAWEEGKKDRYLYQKQREAVMFYRNITPLDDGGNIVCPRCHKVHLME